MKFTKRDALSVCGGIAIMIVLISSTESITTGELSEKLIDGIMTGHIQIINTSTGQPIKINFTNQTIDEWNTFHPTISLMKYLPLIGICCFTVYIGFFTKFQKPTNPFKKGNKFGQ